MLTPSSCDLYIYIYKVSLCSKADTFSLSSEVTSLQIWQDDSVPTISVSSHHLCVYTFLFRLRVGWDLTRRWSFRGHPEVLHVPHELKLKLNVDEG